MGFTDIGEHADIGPGRAHERFEIAIFPSPELDDRHALVTIFEREQELRDADLVVLVLGRCRHRLPGCFERLHGERFRRRLAGTAGNGDHRTAHAVAREPAER